MFIRKIRRNLNELGKKQYNFDYQLERNIYCYLCYEKINIKKIKQMDKTLQFKSYEEWKQYIYIKYNNYNRGQLLNFSRYLKQIQRCTEPLIKYTDFYIPVIMSIFVTQFVNLFYINGFFMSIFFGGILLFFIFIWNFIKPIWGNEISKNFIMDYKSIIDEIIEEKYYKALI